MQRHYQARFEFSWQPQRPLFAALTIADAALISSSFDLIAASFVALFTLGKLLTRLYLSLLILKARFLARQRSLIFSHGECLPGLFESRTTALPYCGGARIGGGLTAKADGANITTEVDRKMAERLADVS